MKKFRVYVELSVSLFVDAEAEDHEAAARTVALESTNDDFLQLNSDYTHNSVRLEVMTEADAKKVEQAPDLEAARLAEQAAVIFDEKTTDAWLTDHLADAIANGTATIIEGGPGRGTH